ncbi:gliding motility-associated-like protein [Flavobacterium sp. CG_9.1]|uniref:DUF7948 domain-containing protein n=1 Tax=Flavobacterium sp. CG_9.1 TaxID=2787728 RepID=UPI0018CA3460|nr:T9SS type B sorting domain-containing protein [Flavobacterium sp. CG_9.1]MBG6061539.1 gliding motility-associated-like protein [Flavobacterium sp. CG_9.1]
MKHIVLSFLLLIITPSFAQQKKKSIGFIENKGQITDQNGKPNPGVQFLLNTDGLNVQIKKNGFSYDIYEVIKKSVKQRIEGSNTFSSLAKNDNKTPDYTLEYVFHRVDIDFVNSNPNVELVTAEASKDYDNYYNVPNKPEGVVNVHLYQQITYKNIYPNIDVVFFVPKDTLKTVEYNFVVHPKGKISDIQMKFNGVKTDLVDNKIQMNVRFGKMEETLPASWTEEGEIKRKITVGYKKIKNNIYGFETANITTDKTVIIDPVPVRLWGTYFGGASGNLTQKIRADKSGNVIITGETSSATNIATSGGFQTTKISIWDASFLSKFTPDGKKIWGTYINSAMISDLAVNTNNDIYIGGSDYGYNSGNNLTTPGAYKTTNPDFSLDGLILKFNANGQLIWGTLFGGSDREKINTLSLDNQENLIIAGETNSSGGIATSNAFQSLNNNTFNGCGFYAKFSSLGNNIHGSYFPGKVTYSAVDNSNNLILSGQYSLFGSNQPDISTPGAHQTQVYYIDAFIVKFNSLEQRIWCTYYGGDASFFISVNDYYDRVTGLGTDELNNIYITGTTNSINNISTTDSHKENQAVGGVDAFIAKFNTEGIRQWGTYYGSNNFIGIDNCESSFTSANGDVYITGNTRSQTDIATTGSFQPVNNGSDEGFISKFDTYGKLEWGTYYGGANQDYIKNIFYDRRNIYTIGTTGSTNLGTVGTEYPTLADGNTFIAKFQDCLSNPLAFSNSPICISNTIELNASGGTNYTWTGPNGFTSTLQNPTILNATTLNSGEYRCLITGTGGCDDTKTVAVIVGDIELPIPDSTTLPTLTGDCNTVITTIPTATDSCAGTITATTASALSYSLPGTYTVVWNYNDGNGNTATQNQTVIITPQPLPTATSPQTFCIQENATINDIIISGQNIKWYDSLTNGSLLSITTSLQNGNTYYASQTINSCESERIPVLINIQNTLAPTGNANQTFCSSQNPTLDTVQISGTSIKWYNSSGTLLSNSTSLQNGMTYYATQTINTCESERIGITISIVNTPATPTANANQNFCKKENARLSAIQIAGQDLNWYETNFSAISLPNSTLLENNKSYYASQTIGCESDRIAILIRIYDTPPPTGNTNQQFCIDENAQISNLNILGSNIKWYDALTNGTALAETTVLSNGVTYYATQTLNDCESEKIAITVTIQDTQIPIGNPNQTFCIQENTKISNIAIEGQNIKWYTSLSSLTTLSESIVLENEMTYYASQTINNCESLRTPITVNILEATNAGCLDLVDELPYPKFFTPNGDGFNDTWTINFAYLKPNTGIKIFDRYGKLITVLNQNETWNGTYNNQQLPATDYWFIATRADGKEDKGHFSLKR